MVFSWLLHLARSCECTEQVVARNARCSVSCCKIGGGIVRGIDWFVRFVHLSGGGMLY